MPRGIGSWRRRENSGRFVGSRLREIQNDQSSETHYEKLPRASGRHFASWSSSWPTIRTP